MKQVIILFAAVIGVSINTTFAADKQAKKQTQSTPVPEVIQCESQKNCQMTRIEVLLKRDQQEAQQNVSLINKQQQALVNKP